MGRPPRRRGRPLLLSPPHLYLCLKSTSILSLLLFVSLHASTLLLPRANSLGRRSCLLPVSQPLTATHLRIAIVSFSDDGDGGEGRRQRSFRGLMAMVRRNKEDYARRWGYTFIDGRDCIHVGRPPSWSKILAVRKYLDGFDWVFWNDADSIVTNPDISLERILQSALGQSDLTDSADLVVTEDVNGVNAGPFAHVPSVGMWFMRRSSWSEAFLDTWWNQTDFVRFGSTRSGDNAALIYLIRSMSPSERRRHICTAAAQCMFNSYPWLPTWKNAYRLIASPRSMWGGVYSEGDFMVHLAGLDDKREWTAKILQDLEDGYSPF